jgi:hypothetical protein
VTQYIVSKEQLDSSTVAITELINSLEEQRQALCLEDIMLMYKLIGTRNELYRIQLNEIYQGENND